ncbi:MAG TPA: hypothetical protein VE621_24230 [Bryobacteraceae bacterium]|nr:hypothetical protein [Bryobacteraceae bacterium]
MVLTKDELIRSVQNEIRIILHLISKIDPAQLEFRPAPKVRSTRELLQYITIFGPMHLKGVLADSWEMESWRQEWTKQMESEDGSDLERVKQKLEAESAMFAEVLGSVDDAKLRETFEMFGMLKGTRGALLVSMLLSHYAAYRMQLFMNLKLSGREELSTMNLWAGIDMPAAAA